MMFNKLHSQPPIFAGTWPREIIIHRKAQRLREPITSFINCGHEPLQE